MKHTLRDHQKDLELLEKAKLTSTAEFSAMMTITGLHTLRVMSERLSIPMDKITAEHVIREFAKKDIEM